MTSYRIVTVGHFNLLESQPSVQNNTMQRKSSDSCSCSKVMIARIAI